MYKKTLIASIILATIMILGGWPENVAQTQESVARAREVLPFSSLSLEIAAPSQSVLSLEPIPIVLRLTNNNSQPALGYKVIGFGNSPVSIYVRKTGTDVRASITLVPISEFIKYTNVPIEPRESIESKDLITLGLARYFPEPGSYDIQARLANSNYAEFIESNIVTINVQLPTIADRSAYNLIRNSTFQEFLFSGAEFDKVENTLKRLNSLYPNSPYARGASFVLGENYFYDRNYPQALINLVRLENDNNFMYIDKVRKYLAEIRQINAIQTEKPELKIPK